MSNLLEYKGYLGSVVYSNADETFHGCIVGINDRITYDGDSVKKLKQDFIAAVDDYIDCCIEIGKEPETPFIGRINIQVAPDLHRKAIGFSVSTNRTLDETVEEALTRFVG